VRLSITQAATTPLRCAHCISRPGEGL
jgi:hypothetical protein